MSIGHRADPSFLAVSRQVTLVRTSQYILFKFIHRVSKKNRAKLFLPDGVKFITRTAIADILLSSKQNSETRRLRSHAGSFIFVMGKDRTDLAHHQEMCTYW